MGNKCLLMGVAMLTAIVCCTSNLLAAKKVITPIATKKPKIDSIRYRPSSELKPGDLVVVEMSGTPGGKATFEIMHFMPNIEMRENSPGAYRAEVKLPEDKTISNAPLVGHLALGGMNAPLVQASALVCVGRQASVTTVPIISHTDTEAPEAISAAQAPSAPSNPEPIRAEPIAPQKTVQVVQIPKPQEPAKEMEQIALKTPPNGAKIKSALLVTGKASPNANVMVTITYSNGLNGIMKLAGQVASQAVAVGVNGDFKVGPYALEGPFATKGLIFTIKAYYTDREDHGTAVSRVFGDRM